MQAIEAIYQGGVFRPLTKVDLPENQRVLVSIPRAPDPDAMTWLARMREHHERFAAERGFLPDSTLDIAEDRMRDD